MLSPYQYRSLLIRSGVLMTLTEICLRRFGFRKCRNGLAWLGTRLPFERRSQADLALAQQIADIVDQARYRTSIYPAQCLTRSLVLDYYLKRFGQDSEIVMGVRTLTGHFAAHAWIVSQGRELNEPESAKDLYTVLNWASIERNSIKA